MRAGSFRLPDKRSSASFDVDDLEPQTRPRVFSLESVSMRTRDRIRAEDSQLSSSLDSVDIKRATDVTTAQRSDATNDSEPVTRAQSSVTAREKKRRMGFSFFRKSLPPKVEQSLSLGETRSPPAVPSLPSPTNEL